MKALVIGGAGYIGSHMVRTLLEEKFDAGVFDNASTGYREFIPVGTPFIKGDLRNESDIRKVFREYAIDAVMHFAASSIVPESMSNLLKYYDNNVLACINNLNLNINHAVVELWGSGSPYREFLYVADLADACVFLMQNYGAKEIGEFVNIGTGVDNQINDLASLIKGIVGFKGEIRWDTSKPDGMPRKLLDISKVVAFGWQPKTSIENGIRKVYSWYLKG